MTEPERPATSEENDPATGLPGLRSWRAVYLVVFGVFVLWVLLLAWLSAHYA